MLKTVKKIYLDLCALKRPYDLPAVDRVQLDSLAVAALLKAWEEGRTTIISSTALEVENDHNPDPARRAIVADILDRFATVGRVAYSPAILDRAHELARLGFRFLDAVHVSSAERGTCDLLVTCDDRLLRVAERAAASLHVQILSPAEALRAVDAEEQP